MIYKEYDEKYKSIHLEKLIVDGETVCDYAKYYNDYFVVTNEFKHALAKEYCSQFPITVTDKIFEKAWEEGHAYGYQEVEICYDELADFVKDIVDIIVENK